MADYARPETLVSTEWMSEHLNDPTVRVIEVDVDTFSYDEAFGVEGPWAQSRGGPLSTPDHFFQSTLGTTNLGTLTIAKNRMQQVINWVNASPHKSHALGYEFLSEWDSYEWTLHPNGGIEPGRHGGSICQRFHRASSFDPRMRAK